MKERDLVALGALLHDIGKFWQRTGENKHLYSEFEKGEVGKHGLHAVWSGEFFTKHVKKKNAEFAEAGLYAKFHHNPEYLKDDPRKETFARIVQTADHLAALFDREKRPPDDPKGQPTFDRLEAIGERICLKPRAQRKPSEYFYLLRPLSITEEIFPSKIENKNISLVEDYKKLWDKFIKEHDLLPAASFRSYFDSLVHLLHKYTWSVPSATYVDYPSISLYDHSRVTAALAVCLYELHQEKDENGGFLLIESDLSGIQNFIYNPAFNGQEVYAGAARRLRGRSFYLNLLLKTLADYTVSELELESVNTLWATGGHFLVIAPNTNKVKTKLDQLRRRVKSWIWKEWRGALGVIIADLEVTKDQLKNFSSVKEELSRKVATLKLQQFDTLFESDEPLDSAWENRLVLKMGVDICCDTGRDIDEQERSLSQEYNDDERIRSLQSLHFDRIGRVLVEAKTIQLRRSPDWNKLSKDVARIPRNEQEAHHYKSITEHALIEFPDFNRCWLLSKNKQAFQGAELCLTFANARNTYIDFLPQHIEPDVAYGFDLFAGEVKTEKGHIAEFDELAKKSEGANFLGVLRMDVDNLGLIFAKGLSQQESSLSKVANVSRMFDWFFSGHLNTLIAGKNLYTTYAGGDDLFVLGAWNEVLQLACDINKNFGKFCAYNPDLHISGGIALCKGKYPVARSAEDAGQALDEIAKRSRIDDTDMDKNSLAFLEQKVNWKRLEEILSLGDEMIKAIESGDLSRKFLYHVLSLYRNHIDPKRDLSKKDREDLIWIPRFLYSLTRNVEDTNLRATLQQEIYNHRKYIPVLVGYVALKTRGKEN
ncbi:MAG: type III-A CRISPR-associated protein Cas10/Csm1 [Acidobacteriota bacterium]|nr:type III-A CRISPR-associated protein Cas10/Csm1 [Blastocatellia bacterium]MDW8412371.1 type III-A CRISPR-associated protein Cas10/Csm1 [Acidobacteriota bacterium]